VTEDTIRIQDDVIDLYRAMTLRNLADKNGNASQYRQAAEIFERYGWSNSATACLQKAEYYEAQP